MNSITFRVDGKPQGKERPRMTKKGHTYTPQKTKDYEQLIQYSFFVQAMRDKFEAIKKPKGVVVYLDAYFQIPKSYSKKQKEEIEKGMLAVTKKPDIDNIAKIFCDGLNGYAYEDDSQVVFLQANKWWTQGESYVEVKVMEKEG